MNPARKRRLKKKIKNAEPKQRLYKLQVYFRSKDEKGLVERAASIRDIGLSLFGRQAVMSEARRIIAEHGQPNGEEKPRSLENL
jgi:hypothetical protein